MKYGHTYLSSSYGATKKPTIVATIVSYTTAWTKIAVNTIDNWIRN